MVDLTWRKLGGGYKNTKNSSKSVLEQRIEPGENIRYMRNAMIAGNSILTVIFAAAAAAAVDPVVAVPVILGGGIMTKVVLDSRDEVMSKKDLKL